MNGLKISMRIKILFVIIQADTCNSNLRLKSLYKAKRSDE